MTKPKGRFGIHGGQYIPETLMNAVHELETAYEHYKKDPAFMKEFEDLLHEYVGRPSGLYYAAHMTEVMGVEHVACGFDFCEFFGPGNEGAEGLESAAHIKNLFYWLEKLGMSERERRMIARENFLRVLGS